MYTSMMESNLDLDDIKQRWPTLGAVERQPYLEKFLEICEMCANTKTKYVEMKSKALAVLENSNDEEEKNDEPYPWSGGKQMRHDALLEGREKYILSEAVCKDGGVSEEEVPLNSEEREFFTSDHDSSPSHSRDSSADSSAGSEEMSEKNEGSMKDGGEEDARSPSHSHDSSADSSAGSKEMSDKHEGSGKDGGEEDVGGDYEEYSDGSNIGGDEQNEQIEKDMNIFIPDDQEYSSDEGAVHAIPKQGNNRAVVHDENPPSREEKEIDPENAFDQGFEE